MDRSFPARITPEIFQDFAWFDMLRRQRRYRAPLIFFLIMAGFSIICFLTVGRLNGALLIGCVLLGVGLVLPLGWLLSFFLSVRAEAKRLKLSRAPVAYTLHLTDAGLSVSNGKEKADFKWEQLHGAFRLRRCVCLYVAPQKAFLLPTGELEDADALWGEICARLPGEKTRNFTGPGHLA